MSFGLNDIHDAIGDINMMGRNINDIEAFIVNSDDLYSLIKSHPQYEMRWFGVGSMAKDDFQLLGVKIIDSHYVPRGTIFKVFKDNNKQYPPGWDQEMANPSDFTKQTINGMTNFSPYVGDKLIEHCKRVANEMKKFGESAKAMDGFNKAKENLPVMEEEKPRHSTTRKVQLD